jgi:peptidyl-prolyl cis-trans isomerase SurA
MKFKLIGIVSVLTILIFSACSSKSSDLLIADFGSYDITKEEFEKAYAKNVGSWEKAEEDSITEYKKFLDLYLNFKMKLRDAEVRDFANNPDMQAELDDYKTKVGISYFKEKELIEPAVKNFYDMRKYELRVSHIMIRPDTISMPEAKKIAEDLIARINNGEKFEELAAQYSHDQFSKDSGGDIYWITAGQIIPSFERAAYATEVGSIYPEPVETRYGYHIVKVTDKQERRNKIQARHILINFVDENNQPDTANALVLAQEIKAKVDAGEDFVTLAQTFSEDQGTAQKGGDLGFFERRMMVKEFDETAFKLNVGEVSDIVKTRFGYHIIEVIDEQPYPSFDESKAEVKSLYEKTYFKDDYAKLIGDVKESLNFKVNENFINYASGKYNAFVFKLDYKESDFYNDVKDSIAFSINGKRFTADSLLANVIESKKINNKKMSEAVLREAINEYSEVVALQEKASMLDETNSEFADLMSDYKNGIFIFKLQEEEVWNKIKIEDEELKKFYEKTKENYTWPDRVEFGEIYSRNDSLIQVYYKMINDGTEFDSVAAKYTERFGLKENAGNHGLVEREKNELSKLAYNLSNEGDISEPIKVTNGWAILKLISKIPSGIKTFEEARAETASAFQEHESKRLEEEYISMLKKRYQPNLYYENLEHVFKTSAD